MSHSTDFVDHQCMPFELPSMRSAQRVSAALFIYPELYRDRQHSTLLAIHVVDFFL